MLKINNTFHERLLFARKEKSLTQTQLANMIGITQRQIAAYEAGKARPREKTLLSLAFHLEVSPSWLGVGVNTEIQEWNSFTPTTELVQVPLYNINELKLDKEGNLVSKNKTTELFPLPDKFNKIKSNAFAIKMQGDAMEMSGRLGVPDGSIITFDPDAQVKSGDICLILIDDYYTIKQLFIDTNQTTARPLNPNYADIVLKKDEYKVIAKAVHISITL